MPRTLFERKAAFDSSLIQMTLEADEGVPNCRRPA